LRWQLPHAFYFDARAQYFAPSIDPYDRHVSDHAIVEAWQQKSRLGVGFGYDQFGVGVDADRFDGSLDWMCRGPMIFCNVLPRPPAHPSIRRTGP
jgi:hypothetical protein